MLREINTLHSGQVLVLPRNALSNLCLASSYCGFEILRAVYIFVVVDCETRALGPGSDRVCDLPDDARTCLGRSISRRGLRRLRMPSLDHPRCLATQQRVAAAALEEVLRARCSSDDHRPTTSDERRSRPYRTGQLEITHPV